MKTPKQKQAEAEALAKLKADENARALKDFFKSKVRQKA